MTAQILYRTDDGREEWHSRQYVSAVDLSGIRPRVMTSIYPRDTTANASDLTQALRFAFDANPRVLAFRITAGDFHHLETRDGREIAA
jgi:hypothetical protein